MSEEFPLDGKTALVTGAARGIGRKISEHLLQAGAAVARADVLPTGDWDNVTHPGHTEVSQHCLDVTSPIQCDRAINEVTEVHGRLDYLVNNAGITFRGPVAETTGEDWSRVIGVNLTGTFQMCRAAYAGLRASKGAVVNIASTNGNVAVKGSVAYCVSKAGVIHLSRVLALEWAEYGIRVNAVGPTIVSTSMTADVRADSTYMSEKMQTIPLGRMATECDVANAVMFLLSPAAAMVTGQTLYVDGGVTVQ
jgi:NAD(P)-dependent dehydrogenase (short-subunit alcohol dehydrogenase family)